MVNFSKKKKAHYNIMKINSPLSSILFVSIQCVSNNVTQYIDFNLINKLHLLPLFLYQSGDGLGDGVADNDFLGLT